jgi:excisionase family DNA binding protein
MNAAPLLTTRDLMARLGCSIAHAKRLVASGQIEVTRLGRSVRITEKALAEYIARNTTPAVGAGRSRRATPKNAAAPSPASPGRAAGAAARKS